MYNIVGVATPNFKNMYNNKEIVPLLSIFNRILSKKLLIAEVLPFVLIFTIFVKMEYTLLKI